MTTLKRFAGMVWYRLADYDACRAIMADRELLPTTYSSWRTQAEQNEKQMQRQGFTTVRAYLNPSEFIAWCGARGLNVDAKARNEFAVSVALQATEDLECH